MDSSDDISNGGRVTRARQKRLVSIDSEASSRPGTPLSPQRVSKINIKTEVETLPKRVTRRNSISNTPEKTPSKIKDIGIGEVNTPSRRTRRRTSSVHEDSTPKILGKQQIHLSVLPEEDLKENQIGKNKVQKSPKREKSKSPLQKSVELPKKKLNRETETDSDIEVINLADSDIENNESGKEIPVHTKISPKLETSSSGEKCQSSLNSVNSNIDVSSELKNNGSNDVLINSSKVIASSVVSIDWYEEYDKNVNVNNAEKDTIMLDENTPNSSIATGEQSKSIHSKSVTFENSTNLNESKTAYPKTPMLRKKGSPLIDSKMISNKRSLQLTDSMMNMDGEKDTDFDEDNGNKDDTNKKDCKNEEETLLELNKKTDTPKRLQAVSIESRCSTPNVMKNDEKLSNTPTPEKLLRSGKSYGDSPTPDSNNSLKSETEEMNVNNQLGNQNKSKEEIISIIGSPKTKLLSPNANNKSSLTFSQKTKEIEKELDVSNSKKSPKCTLLMLSPEKATTEHESKLISSPKCKSSLAESETMGEPVDTTNSIKSIKSKSFPTKQKEITIPNIFKETKSPKSVSLPIGQEETPTEEVHKNSKETKDIEKINDSKESNNWPKSISLPTGTEESKEELVESIPKNANKSPKLITNQTYNKKNTVGELSTMHLSPMKQQKLHSLEKDNIKELNEVEGIPIHDNDINEQSTEQCVSEDPEENNELNSLFLGEEHEKKDTLYEEENTYAKSWAQSVKKSSYKIDTIDISKGNLAQKKDNEVVESSKSVLKLQVDSTDENSEDEDSDSVADELKSHLDCEAKSMGRNYESGDSMDEEERELYDENNLDNDEGESIGSVDSSEDDVEEELLEDNNSFIVPSDEEDEENLLSYSDDEHLNEVKKKKTYKRLKKISTDTEDEETLSSGTALVVDESIAIESSKQQKDKNYNGDNDGILNLNTSVLNSDVHNNNVEVTLEKESSLVREGPLPAEKRRSSQKASILKDDGVDLEKKEETEMTKKESPLKPQNSFNVSSMEVDEEIKKTESKSQNENKDQSHYLQTGSLKKCNSLSPIENNSEGSQIKEIHRSPNSSFINVNKNNEKCDTPTKYDVVKNFASPRKGSSSKKNCVEKNIPVVNTMEVEKTYTPEKHNQSRKSLIDIESPAFEEIELHKKRDSLNNSRQVDISKEQSSDNKKIITPRKPNTSLVEAIEKDSRKQQNSSFIEEKQLSSKRKSVRGNNANSFDEELALQVIKNNTPAKNRRSQKFEIRGIENLTTVSQKDEQNESFINNNEVKQDISIKKKDVSLKSAIEESVVDGPCNSELNKKPSMEHSKLDISKEMNIDVEEADKSLKHNRSRSISMAKENIYENKIQETQNEKTEFYAEFEKTTTSPEKGKKRRSKNTTVFEELKLEESIENDKNDSSIDKHVESNQIEKERSNTEQITFGKNQKFPSIMKRQRSKSFIETNNESISEKCFKKRKTSVSFDYETKDFNNIESTELAIVKKTKNSTDKKMKLSFEEATIEKIDKIHDKNTSTPFVKKTGLITNTHQDDMRKILYRCNEMLEEAEKTKKIMKENKNSRDKKKIIKQKNSKDPSEKDISSNFDNKKLAALHQAIQVSQNILTRPTKKRQREQTESQNDENKYESKRLPADILQAVSTSSNVGTHNVPKKRKKNELVEEQFIERKVFKSICGDLIVESLIDLPEPKKPKPVEVIKTSTGDVRVEPITPLRKNNNNSGFRESPITPKTTGWKMNQLLKLNAGKTYNQSPVSTIAEKKRKRRMAAIDEPKNKMLQPTWTKSAGFFKIDKVENGKPKVLGNCGTTEFGVVDLNNYMVSSAAERAKNFREAAIYSENARRENAHNLLRRKRFFN